MHRTAQLFSQRIVRNVGTRHFASVSRATVLPMMFSPMIKPQRRSDLPLIGKCQSFHHLGFVPKPNMILKRDLTGGEPYVIAAAFLTGIGVMNSIDAASNGNYPLLVMSGLTIFFGLSTIAISFS
ncbi:MAG: hypothetical protein Harvfovirus12_15 [Harvfovirus sp.]|uniref:Uncharacterized protein n=1 Tax=Harvfovirus sp. TaxID=2487768 RepID=A0A3G5A671_9VIRU|nr:MAG: hypothetical protein Harvfovirus12_15 [Harvfovirus sp.]